MPRSKRKRVFILGAGCSARYGYPLGGKLTDELRSFLAKVARIPGGCPVIQGAVSKSVGLAARFPEAATLDQLVNLCEERFKTFRGGRSIAWETADAEHLRFTNEQILNAKIAMAALFLDKEREARETTLEGYKESLLPDISGRGPRWQSAVNDSDCSVLTFNYDRLFEIAFLDLFRDFDPNQYPLYGNWVLNSGFDFTLPWGLKRIEIAPDRFCFLKLHGSAGWWAKRCATNASDKWRDYGPDSPHDPPNLLTLDRWLGQNKQPYPWEPLIAFPHEKQRFTSGHPGDFEQGPYIGKIWKRAAAVLEEATEVTVIGYSFAPIDRTHLVENLLSRTQKTTRIRIENKDVEAVKRALGGFEVLQDRLEIVERVF